MEFRVRVIGEHGFRVRVILIIIGLSLGLGLLVNMVKVSVILIGSSLDFRARK